ncbi:MAG: hypothetical protein IKB51_02220 [Clostridia bacterium]|nr:hypothetical protein [Clostridia bacterium]
MKMRLLSLFMCVLMIASAFVFASCGEDENINTLGGESDKTTVSNQTPMTISIYSVRGKGTTDEAVELVEEALTRIALRRYNTTIDLVLIDEAEYCSQMFAKIRMSVNSYNTERMGSKSLDAAEKEAIKKSNVDYQYLTPDNEKIDYHIKQATNLNSDVLDGELDIFLVYTPEAGIESMYTSNAPASRKIYSMFDILYNEQALAPLGTYLNGEYSAVKSVIYSHALEYVTRPGYPTSGTQDKQAKNIFGIPNNYIYGNYEYAIFDTTYVNNLFGGADKSAYADAYGVYAEYVSAYNSYLNSYENYLKQYRAAEDATKHPWEPVAPYAMVDEYGEKYTELKAEYDAIMQGLVGETTLYAASVETAPEAPTGMFAELVKELAAKKGQEGFEYDKIVEYFPDEGAYEAYLKSNETFAIGIAKGNKSIETLFAQHEHLDTYIAKKNNVAYPIGTPAEDLDAYCESMFCIGTPTMANNGARAKRCMQIMDLLNNNKEFRNVFQYGVEGTHFTQYSEEVIPLESPKAESKYFMDMRYTGNMFILYTSSDMDEATKLMSKSNWQLAKDQNVDLAGYRIS